MEKTKLTFYSGLDTIGGVVLEVKYGKDRAFFEAGTAYNPAFDMFDQKVDKRQQFISDFLWVNDLPRINGIYRKEDVSKYNLLPASSYDGNQAFFISHLHLDHMRMMGMIDPSVKVYLSKPAQIIEKALEDVNMGVDKIRDNYLDMEDDMNVGEIHIHRFILNDDSYQDYSFYIETPDLKLHFTGDIFVYGKYFANIKNEISYINDKNIDILMPEGTTFWADVDKNIKVSPTFNPDKLLSKQEDDERLINIINKHNGLVVFNHYEREMSDVIDLFNFEKETKRTLVFEPEAAHIINKFFNKKVNIIIPDTYIKKPSYLDEIIKSNNVINKQSIINNPEAYLLQNAYPNLLELIDYRNANILYLHISGQPIGAFDPKFKNMMNLLNALGAIYQHRQNFEDGYYFSSHATREQLLEYLEEVNCKLIVPCHSANRDAYINNINKPHFKAEVKKTYVYNKEFNTLEEVDYE